MEEQQYKLVLSANDLNVIGQALGNLSVPVKEAHIVQGLINKISTQVQDQNKPLEE
jgi:hypothetical protein